MHPEKPWACKNSAFHDGMAATGFSVNPVYAAFSNSPGSEPEVEPGDCKRSYRKAPGSVFLNGLP